MKKTIIITAVILAITGTLIFGAGISGVPILNMHSSAVSASLAGVCMARGGVGSLWYNPAGTAEMENSASEFTYFNDMAGFTNMFLDTAFVFKGIGALGISLAYSGAGMIDNSVEGDVVEARDIAGMAGYSQIINNNIQAGVALKYIESKLGTFAARTFAVDAGMLMDINDILTAGAAVKNIGPPLKYYTDPTPLPFTAGIGLSLKAIKSSSHALNLGADAIYAITDKALRLGASAEYVYARIVSLRAGYMYENGSVSGLGAGAGIKTPMGWGSLEINYAYAPSFIGTNNTENRHLITIIIAY